MRQITVTVYVVADAELKSSKNNGTPYISMRVANNEFVKKDGDENVYDTKFFIVTSFDKRDLHLYKYYKKGSKLIIEGDYSDDLYTNPNTNIISISRRITANRIWFNSDKKNSIENNNVKSGMEQEIVNVEIPVKTNGIEQIVDITDIDDLPF